MKRLDITGEWKTKEQIIRRFLKQYELKCKSGYRVTKTKNGSPINFPIGYDDIPLSIYTDRNGYAIKVNGQEVYRVKHQQQFNAKEAYSNIGMI